MASHKIIFQGRAAKEIEEMDGETAKIILRKLRWYANHENPLFFAVRLKSRAIGQYRFRIGSYRAIFDIQDDAIIILRVGHRSTVYR